MAQTTEEPCAATERHMSAPGGLLFEALLRDTALAVAVIDAAGTMTMMSPALEELAHVHYAPVAAAAIPRHFNLCSPDGRRVLEPHEEPLNRARSGESFRDELVSLRRDDGTLVFLRCSGSSLRAEDGTSLGGIVLFTDVTSEYQATRDQEMLRDRLVETFNHELRTPLTTLLGHAEVLEDLAADVEAVLPAQATRSLGAVRSAGERIRQIADTVTEMVDLQSARRVHREPVELSQLVVPVVRRHRVRAGEGISVVLALPGSLTVNVDPVQTRRALDALVANAVHHTVPHSVVEVRVHVVGDDLVMEVADHGPGIPVRDRVRLVQPFERGDVDLTSPSSKGLGLAVARSVAVAHGGGLRFLDNGSSGLRAVLRLALN